MTVSLIERIGSVRSISALLDAPPQRDGLNDPPFRSRDTHWAASNPRPKVFSLIHTIRQLRTTRSFAVISLNVLGMDVTSLTSMAAPSGEMLMIVQRVLNPI